MTDDKDISDIEAFVIPLLDEAFERASIEGPKHSCCSAHLADTIESCLMKNVVRNIVARHYAINNRLPTNADMHRYSIDILCYIKGYYEEVMKEDKRNPLSEFSKKGGSKLH